MTISIFLLLNQECEDMCDPTFSDPVCHPDTGVQYQSPCQLFCAYPDSGDLVGVDCSAFTTEAIAGADDGNENADYVDLAPGGVILAGEAGVVATGFNGLSDGTFSFAVIARQTADSGAG